MASLLQQAANPYLNDPFAHQRMVEEAMIAQQRYARGLDQQQARYIESIQERAQRQDENPVLLLLG